MTPSYNLVYQSEAVYPTYQFGRWDLAKKVEYHDLENALGRMPSWSQRLSGLLRQFPHIYLYDQYADEQFDTLIIGSDLVLNLIAAIQLCREGQRVLLYRSEPEDLPEGYQELFQQRYDYQAPELVRYLQRKLQLSVDPEDPYGVVRALCQTVRAEEGQGGEVLLVDNFDLYSSNGATSEDEDGRQLFWLDQRRHVPDDAGWSLARQTLRRLRVPASCEQQAWGRDIQPILLTRASRVLLTSLAHPRLMAVRNDRVVRLGNAEVMITELPQFNARHRLLDLVSALAVVDLMHHETTRASHRASWQRLKAPQSPKPQETPNAENP